MRNREVHFIAARNTQRWGSTLRLDDRRSLRHSVTVRQYRPRRCHCLSAQKRSFARILVITQSCHLAAAALVVTKLLKSNPGHQQSLANAFILVCVESASSHRLHSILPVYCRSTVSTKVLAFHSSIVPLRRRHCHRCRRRGRSSSMLYLPYYHPIGRNIVVDRIYPRIRISSGADTHRRRASRRRSHNLRRLRRADGINCADRPHYLPHR